MQLTIGFISEYFEKHYIGELRYFLNILGVRKIPWQKILAAMAYQVSGLN